MSSLWPQVRDLTQPSTFPDPTLKAPLQVVEFRLQGLPKHSPSTICYFFELGPVELQSKLLKGDSIGDYIGDYY